MSKLKSAGLDRILAMEIVRVSERAAIAAARFRGRGDERAADAAAGRVMHAELDRLPVRGTIVIGEGEADEASLLFLGETLGEGKGPQVDIAVDPLDGHTMCAKDQPNALSVVVVGERGSLLAPPNVYMQKLAIGPAYPPEIADLDASPEATIRALADAKSVAPKEITACVLDRPRHAGLIDAVRSTGASIRLIADGDVAGIIHAMLPEQTGIDIYLGSGGACEGVLAAAAVRCFGGQMRGRLMIDSAEKAALAARLGFDTPDRIYTAEDMAKGDLAFAATGVTDGTLLSGVRFLRGAIATQTLMLRSSSGTVREIRAIHRDA